MSKKKGGGQSGESKKVDEGDKVSNAPRKQTAVPLQSARMSVAAVLRPALDGIAAWLAASAVVPNVAISAGSKRSRKEADGELEDEAATRAKSIDVLVDHLVELHDLVDTHQKALLPSAGIIVSHLTPVLLRKKAPVEAWELAATLAAVFGAWAVSPLLKSVVEQLAVDREEHPIFSSAAKLSALEALLYCAYESVLTVDRNVLLGAILTRGVQHRQRRLQDLCREGKISSCPPVLATSASEGALTADEEREVFLTYHALIRVVCAAIQCCRPVLPALLSTAQVLLSPPAVLLTNTGSGGTTTKTSKVQEGLLSVRFPPFVAVALSQLRSTLAVLQHPTVAPLALPTIDMSIPAQFAGSTGTANKQETDNASESIVQQQFSDVPPGKPTGFGVQLASSPPVLTAPPPPVAFTTPAQPPAATTTTNDRPVAQEQPKKVSGVANTGSFPVPVVEVEGKEESIPSIVDSDDD